VADAGSGNLQETRQPELDLPDLSSGRVAPAPESAKKAPTVFSNLSPAKPTEVFDTFWHFASERQAVFFKRLRGYPFPWSEDPILRRYKFTNSYRASDRVSQYLIKNVIYEGDQSPDEVFFRTILFKVFNRIETWKMLEGQFGMMSYRDYSYDRYDALLTGAMERGERIFSAAYIMPSGGRSSRYARKHRYFLRLIERMMRDAVPECLGEARSMKQAFEILHEYPMMGDFLAYQYVTDLNYSEVTDFTEMEFVVPGPGARSGIRKCFSDLGGLNETEIIKVVTDRQEKEFDRLGLDFETLWGRPLQLIDCQNLFCEVDKYARVAHPYARGATGRTRIKQTYLPNPEPLGYWYPPKWGINDRIHIREDGS
jgi:hypothetical protein